jgi:hypothetical protein
MTRKGDWLAPRPGGEGRACHRGSRGIGAAVARALAGAGADVALTHLNSRQAAENVAAEMRAPGMRARAVRADQADPAAASAIVRQVAGEVGRLDIVVNNAAVAVHGPIDGPVSDGTALDRQIRVNYTSIVAVIRAAAHVLPMEATSSTSARGQRRVPAPQASPTTRDEGGTRRVHPAARRVTWPPRASPSTCCGRAWSPRSSPPRRAAQRDDSFRLCRSEGWGGLRRSPPGGWLGRVTVGPPGATGGDGLCREFGC